MHGDGKPYNGININLTTSRTVGYRKPHPKIFEDMIDQLGVKPSEIMYVGDDALNDVAPACNGDGKCVV